MANSLNGIGASPFAGLGTASYQVPVAGLYSMEFKSFIPYIASGSQPQTSSPVAEVQNVATVADSSGSLNSTYWTFNDAGNAHGYYVWYNINSAGVDPAPAGLTGIQVTGATGASANTIASNTRSAINAVSGISVVASGATNNVILSNSYPGTTTAAANGTASPGFTFTVPTAGSWGVPAISGLVVVMKQNNTVLGTVSNPSPTQPMMGGKVQAACSANDTLSFVLSSQSPSDSTLNSIKSILNIYLGE